MVGPPCETKYTGVRAIVEIGRCKAEWVLLVVVLSLRNLLNLGKARLSCFMETASAVSSTKNVMMNRFEYQDIEGLLITSPSIAHFNQPEPYMSFGKSTLKYLVVYIMRAGGTIIYKHFQERGTLSAY